MNASPLAHVAILSMLVGIASAQIDDDLNAPRTLRAGPKSSQRADVVGAAARDPRGLKIARALLDVRTPIHTAPDDPEGGPYGTWATGSDYKVSFHNGFTFVPYLGGGYPNNQPLSWRTTSVTVGGTHIVDVEASPERNHSDWRYEYQWPGFVEAYDIRVDGAEQTFTLLNKPGHGGDLVVTGRITSNLTADLALDRHGQVSFRDAQGNVLVHYGAATVLDADGRKLAMPTSWDGADISLRVPAAWLANASYPVTIDPLMTRECTAFWSSTGLANGDALEVDVGRDDLANQPMVAYTRQASATDEDLWVWLFDTDAAAFTGRHEIFRDVTSSWGNASPSIAMGGGAADDWIIAFIRMRVGGGGTQNGARYHLHASGDTTANTSVSAISRPSGSSHGPAIDVGGVQSFALSSSVFVVYERTDSRSNTDVFGKPIDLNGNAQGTEILIDQGSGTREGPAGTKLTRRWPNINQIATGGSTADGWVVAFQEFWDARPGGGDDWDVNLRRISATGTLVGSASFPSNSTPDDTHKLSPVLEGAGGRFSLGMTTWQELLMTKTSSTLGGRVMNQVFNWAASSTKSTNINLCDLTDGLVADRRWSLTDVAYDSNSDDHWCFAFTSVLSGSTYFCTTGYDGGRIERLRQTISGSKAFAGAATFNDDNNQFLVAFATNESGAACGSSTSASHPVYTNHFTRLPVTTPVRYGTACGPATIGWSGLALVGERDFTITLTGATPNSVAGLLFSLGSSNTPLDYIGMTGCVLNIDPRLLIIAPSLRTDAAGSARANLPLPTCPNLACGTFYFQWSYLRRGANPLGVLATQGLRVAVACR
ncbi:MAG: hypothetical protein GY944_21185 [bacterium]|nr:hypothetical protein [bacterium]